MITYVTAPCGAGKTRLLHDIRKNDHRHLILSGKPDEYAWKGITAGSFEGFMAGIGRLGDWIESITIDEPCSVDGWNAKEAVAAMSGFSGDIIVASRLVDCRCELESLGMEFTQTIDLSAKATAYVQGQFGDRAIVRFIMRKDVLSMLNDEVIRFASHIFRHDICQTTNMIEISCDSESLPALSFNRLIEPFWRASQGKGVHVDVISEIVCHMA